MIKFIMKVINYLYDYDNKNDNDDIYNIYGYIR